MSSHLRRRPPPTDPPDVSGETAPMATNENLRRRLRRVVMLQSAAVLCVAGGGFLTPAAAAEAQAEPPVAATPKPHHDVSGHSRVGKASFYAKRFGGRKMADGTPMQLQGNNAASKTLPLGTTAMVTNLKTGRTAIVTIRDRGPYVKGRIVDLSPSTAHKIGLEPKEGVTKVEVAPLEVPLPDGKLKAGGPYPDPKKDHGTFVAKSSSDQP